MLLCIDIGNTNIVMGVYHGDEIIAHWRVSTDHQKMPDEYGILLMSYLAHASIAADEIKGAVMASVVPPLTDTFQEMIDSYLGQDVLVVGNGTRTGVPIRVENPREVGADRVVNAVAAYRLYGGPACVVDFGTATTFDALSDKGEYLGGAISPGIRVAAEALFQRTAKLPRIDLQPPPNAIGRNTMDSMRSGILLGYVGLVEGMVARFGQELGPSMRVIATGGLARVIGAQTPVIQVVDSWLTLKGLNMIWMLNRGAP